MKITSSFPPIFCISLARAAERRVQMTERLNALGVPYEIIDAVDGKELDLSTLDGRLQQNIMRRQKRRNLTLGEIGCYLSHYSLWQRLVADNIASALVVEDDASFLPDFLSIAAAAVSISCEWDMIILHTHPKRKINQTLTKIYGTDFSICRMDRKIAGTTAYLISLHGAQKLLEHGYRINLPVDVMTSGYWESGLRYYAVYPQIVAVDGTPSTIPNKKLLKGLSLVEFLHAKIWRLRRYINYYRYNLRNRVPRI